MYGAFYLRSTCSAWEGYWVALCMRNGTRPPSFVVCVCLWFGLCDLHVYQRYVCDEVPVPAPPASTHLSRNVIPVRTWNHRYYLESTQSNTPNTAHTYRRFEDYKLI